MPGLRGVYCFPGDNYYVIKFDQSPLYVNHHAGASYVKMIANMIIQNTPDYAFTSLSGSWNDDTSDDSKPQVAVQFYGDDLITPELVRQLAAAKIPLMAVITRDPGRSFYAAGIHYAYDPQSGIYTGRSQGRGDAFTFKPSPYARYYAYTDEYVRMVTLAEFAGQALVYFDQVGELPPRNIEARSVLAHARSTHQLSRNWHPTVSTVNIPAALNYTVPAKDFTPPHEYMTMADFLSSPHRSVDTTLNDPIDVPSHCLDLLCQVAIQGVVFDPGCYKFIAKSYKAIAIRVRHDDPTQAWSTYRHIAERQVAFHHADPTCLAAKLWVANRLTSACRTLPVDNYSDVQPLMRIRNHIAEFDPDTK